MSRRVSMPGADELFRATVARGEADASSAGAVDKPRASGRVKHDEKMTIYLTSDELLALEQARLSLRSQLGRGVDRGRLVRAALAGALADLAENGLDSDVARRLSEPT